jgi:hypothetical protein
MVVELGPCQAEDAVQWLKFARRIITELRSIADSEQVLPPDVVELWSQTLDEWNATAIELGASGEPFRWSADMEPEVAEYLLHGLDVGLHSPTVLSWMTPVEIESQRAFTKLVVLAFVDGLTAEGRSGRHYADQILVSLGDLLED